jgi:hypothetical protein
MGEVLSGTSLSWVSLAVSTTGSIFVAFLAWYLPRRSSTRDALGSSLAAAQDHIFKAQQEIIDGLREEIREMRDRIGGLEEANRECMAQNTDHRRRIRYLENAVKALGGNGV